MALLQRLTRQSHLGHLGLLAAILLLTAGLYVQVWHHTLVWDEHSLTNQRVVLHPSWANYLRSVQETYRPLALLSVVVDHLIWRGWPPGYAVDSLLVHLAVVALFFSLIRGWVAPFPAAVSTMIVALHPAGAETVHYLLGRPDLLSAGSLLASLLAFRRLDHADRRPVTLALFWGLGLLALAAKETALLLPCLALVLCFTQMESSGEESGRIRRHMIAIAPFVMLGCFYIAARVGGWMAVGTPIHLHVGVQQLAVMAATTAAALNILFLPVDLCPWYEGRIAIPSSAWPAAGALLISLAGVIYLIWRFRHRAPAVSVGLAWLTGILALIVIRAAADPTPMNPLAVRWLYPAVIGTALGIGGLLHWIEPLWPRISRAGAVCGVFLLTGLTWQAQSVWQNDLTLFQHGTACNPHSVLLTIRHIDALTQAGQQDQAGRLFAELQTRQPDHPRVLYRAIRMAIDRGSDAEALAHARTLTTVAPSALSYRTMAGLLVLTGQSNLVEAAVEAYRKSLEYSPEDVITITSLGNLYEAHQRWNDAASLYRAGLARHPDAANLWFRLGRVLEQDGRLQEAATAFKQVTQVDRYCPDGYLAAARVERQLADPASARLLLEQYAALAHHEAVPRETGHHMESPCGVEVTVMYQPKTPATPP